jgi:hypothetical protein
MPSLRCSHDVEQRRVSATMRTAASYIASARVVLGRLASPSSSRGLRMFSS